MSMENSETVQYFCLARAHVSPEPPSWIRASSEFAVFCSLFRWFDRFKAKGQSHGVFTALVIRSSLEMVSPQREIGLGKALLRWPSYLPEETLCWPLPGARASSQLGSRWQGPRPPTPQHRKAEGERREARSLRWVLA